MPGTDVANERLLCIFARYDLPHRATPGVDLDLVSGGVVKVLDDPALVRERRYPDMPWEPKAAFDTLAEFYGGHGR